MAAPEYDWRLHQDLTAMMESGEGLHRFYCRASWRRLRASVLAEFHGECADCLREAPARYTPAECVHHVHEVEDEPGWALSAYVPDGRGGVERNLVPLCHRHHDERHGRFAGRPRRCCDAPDLTPERW